jgi:hypothetical protein
MKPPSLIQLALALVLAAVVCSLTSCANFAQDYQAKTGLTLGQSVGIAGQTYDQVIAARAANRTSAKEVIVVTAPPAEDKSDSLFNRAFALLKPWLWLPLSATPKP